MDIEKQNTKNQPLDQQSSLSLQSYVLFWRHFYAEKLLEIKSYIMKNNNK